MGTWSMVLNLNISKVYYIIPPHTTIVEYIRNVKMQNISAGKIMT